MWHPASRVARGLRLLCMGTVLAGSACTTMPAPHAVPPLDARRTEQVLAALAAREERLAMIQGLFQASIAGSLPVAHSITGLMSYQRPHSIRLKGFTRWGGILFDFQQQRERFTLRVPGRTVETLAGTLDQLDGMSAFGHPVRLALHALRPLVGLVTRDSGHILVYDEGEQYRLDLYHRVEDVARAPYARVWIDGRRFEASHMEWLDQQGMPGLTVKYEDYREVRPVSPGATAPRIRLPFRVHARDVEQSVSVTLTFVEILVTIV